MFIEVSPQLARERGLENAGWATVVTARAAIEARVLVTERLRPLRIEGRTIHQVWMPYHWGPGGLVTGDSANDLFGISLDPNVLIQESKVGTCDVRPGRRPSGQALLDLVISYRDRSGVKEGEYASVVTAEGAASNGTREGDPSGGGPEEMDRRGEGSEPTTARGHDEAGSHEPGSDDAAPEGN
jgi:formate dehydrogenase major subunit